MSDVVSGSENLRMIPPVFISRHEKSMTLRDVDTDSDHFRRLVQSIAKPIGDSDHGLINPIAVRPKPGESGQYILVDGLHRFTAWVEAFGKSKSIPCYVRDVSETEALKAQIIGNALTKPTAKAEYAKQLTRLFDVDPLITVEDVAKSLDVDVNTLKSWLNLAKLSEDLQVKVDAGDIPQTVAYALARLNGKAPADNPNFWFDAQRDWYKRWEQMKDEQQAALRFYGEVSNAVKELRKEARGDATRGAAQFTVTPILRKKGDIQIQLKRDREEIDTAPTGVMEAAKKVDPTTFEYIHRRGFASALEYVLQVDEETVASNKAIWEEQQKAKQAATEEKKAGKKSESVARSSGKETFFGMKF